MAENNENLSLYELGYHLVPELAQDELRVEVEKTQDYLTRLGGVITGSREPKRTHLSYPIRHKKYSFFGTFDFKADPEMIEKLSQDLKLNEKVMRFVVLKHNKDEKVLKSITRKTRVKPSAPQTTKQDEVVSEEIEKQIDEVIKNI